jgi:hypothetical protein
MDAFHELNQMLSRWQSAIRRFMPVAADGFLAGAYPASSASHHALPAISKAWCLEHEIASAKHSDSS